GYGQAALKQTTGQKNRLEPLGCSRFFDLGEVEWAYFFFFPFFSLTLFLLVFFSFAAAPPALRSSGQFLQCRPDLRYLRQHFFFGLSFFFPKGL
ncbi:MAG: hypothetical protein ACYC9M_13550, partial [Desulfobulbaceae bacterium]